MVTLETNKNNFQKSHQISKNPVDSVFMDRIHTCADRTDIPCAKCIPYAPCMCVDAS